jgi:hypothetical protein
LDGRTLVLSPVFHYLAALPALAISPSLAGLLLSNLLAALLVIPAFLICSRFARPGLALFAALLLSVVPALLANALELAPLNLALLLFLAALAAFLGLKQDALVPFVILVALLAFSHPISLLLAASLGIYLVILPVLGQRLPKHEVEAALFAIALTLWAQFLISKRLLAAHGPAVFWQNIPPELFQQHFSAVTVTGALALIGFVPLVLGTLVVYRSFLGTPRKEALLVASMAIAAALALWARLVTLQTGLLLLGVPLALLVAPWLEGFQAFVRRSRFGAAESWLVGGTLLVLLLATALPAVGTVRAARAGVPGPDTLAVLDWMRETTSPDVVVFGLPEEGQLIASRAQRQAVMSTSFLLLHDARQRFIDSRRVFATRLETEAVQLFTKYDATYILVSPLARSRFKLTGDLGYSGTACFRKAFEQGDAAVFWKNPGCFLRTVAR